MKRILAQIITILLIFSMSVSAAPSFGGSEVQTTGGTEVIAPESGDSAVSADGVPDMSDDFSIMQPHWSAYNNMTPEDGVLKTNVKELSSIYSVNDNWENFNMECDFTIKAEPDDNSFWFGFSLRGTCVFLYRAQFQYKSEETGVQSGGTIPQALESEVPYTVRIEAGEKAASVYLKRKASGSFTKLGMIPISKTKGTVGLEAWVSKLEFDNFKVWNTTKKAVTLDKIMLTAFKGESAKLNATVQNGEEVEFTSSNTNVATVNYEGTINPVNLGSTLITAKGKASGVEATCYVSVVTPLKAIVPCTMERTMYTGDSVNFTVTASPAEAYNAQLIWSVSDESILSITGSSYTARGVKGHKPGDATLSIASADGTISQDILFHIVERPELETEDIEFSMKGISHKIPDIKFGVCAATADGSATWGRTRELHDRLTAHDSKLIKDIGFKHVKTFAAHYDPYKGKSTKEGSYEWGDKFYIEDYINQALDAGVQHIWDANSTIIDSSKFEKGPDLETCLMAIKKLKEMDPDHPVMVVYTCEAYAKVYEDTIPTAADYVEQCKILSKRIKEEIDPDAKFVVTMMTPASYRGIIVDPNNWLRNEDDLEYTQGERVYDWVAELTKGDTSWFDGYDCHNYTNAFDGINITADDYMDECTVHTIYSHRGGYVEFQRLFDGKEYWDTEWGELPYWQYYASTVPERSRMENQRTVGAAVVVLTELGEHMMIENMKISSYFHTNDKSGFGLTSYSGADGAEPVYYPYYYALKAAGEIFGANGRCDYAYPLTVTKGKTITSIKHMNSDSEPLNTYDAYAYGFGDEDNLKEVMITNCGYKTMRVKITDSKLKKTCEYKPKDYTDPYEGFFVKTQQDWDELTNDMVTKPTYFEDGEYEEYIEVPPYSAVIASVECSAQKNVLSDDINAKLNGSLVLRADSAKAILPDGFVRYIDPANPDVKPATVNDRTMVPLRIGVEAFKDTNVVWNGNEDSITVDCLAAKIKMFVGDPILKCDFNITVDGDEWTVESDVAPQVINDRTLVPIRVLTETMKKNVFWDEETKLIIIGDSQLDLSRDELNSISAALN